MRSRSECSRRWSTWRIRQIGTFPSGVTLSPGTGATRRDAEHWDPNGVGLPLYATGPQVRRVKLSANFTVGELVSSGGRAADVARMSPQLVRCLQALRDRLGKPVRVSSGYRSWARNVALYRARGGNPTFSRHCSGQAADISVAGMSGLDVAKAVLDSCGPDIAVGIGSTYAHVDVRGTWTRWSYASGAAAARDVAAIDAHRRGLATAPTPPTGEAGVWPLGEDVFAARSNPVQTEAFEYRDEDAPFAEMADWTGTEAGEAADLHSFATHEGESTSIGTPSTHRCASGEGPPAASMDPAAQRAHPLIYKGAGAPSRNPAVGYAQQLLNRFLADTATGFRGCIDQSPQRLAYLTELRGQLVQNRQHPLVVDCRFGTNTEYAVKAFQTCYGLVRDGKIGPVTWHHLDRYSDARPKSA